VLGVFKYASFAGEAVSLLAPALGWSQLEILLPLGISFYTFQIIALAVDVARGNVEPPERFSRYALFVSFFPQLIAGPILRGAQLLPQLRGGGRPTPERTRRGLWLLASGAAKKVVLGDFLLPPFVDEVYRTPETAPAYLLVATYAFAFQIYFDFSGYTDMARGIGALLGFELPANFREPYLSRSPAEFWRRWHVTLSTWLRDYLYIPLGGNRRGPARTAVNLGLTMLLGGLWHGAGWNFLVWGGLQGAFLIAHRRWRHREPSDPPLRWRDLPRIVLCFHAMCLGWVFFRAESLADALTVLRGLGRLDLEGPWPGLPLAVVLLCALLHGAERWLRPRLPRVRATLGEGALGGAVEGAALGALAAAVFAASGVGAEFIYFQF